MFRKLRFQMIDDSKKAVWTRCFFCACQRNRLFDEEGYMPQKSLTAWIETLDKTGLLARYSDEMRADELPTIMEENPDKAVYVER